MDRNVDQADVHSSIETEDDSDMNKTTSTTVSVSLSLKRFEAIWTNTNMFQVFMVCNTALNSPIIFPVTFQIILSYLMWRLLEQGEGQIEPIWKNLDQKQHIPRFYRTQYCTEQSQ